MDSINLKDFRPDNPDLDTGEESIKNSDGEIPASIYHEEINTLKIDKLSNRVTIISIIIPCLISAILVFAYLDIKGRMIDVDLTKQNQVKKISQQLEEEFNALDVKIAKNKFELDNTLPELHKKIISLEGRITKIISTKADSKTIKTRFKKLEKRLANNTNQDKITLKTIERINRQTLSTIKENQNQFNAASKQIKDEIALFKEEFDARLLELSDYEQQIGELGKDLSLLDKKFKALERETVSKNILDEKIKAMRDDLSLYKKNLDQQVNTLNKKLTTNISRLQKNLDRLSKSSTPTVKPRNLKPKPQINIDSSGTGKIKQESLTQ